MFGWHPRHFDTRVRSCAQETVEHLSHVHMQSSGHNSANGDGPEKVDCVVTLVLKIEKHLGGTLLVMSVRVFLEELQERESTMKVGRANRWVSVLDKREREARSKRSEDCVPLCSWFWMHCDQPHILDSTPR